MTPTAVLPSSTGTKEPLSGDRKGALTCGGAKGTRTPNPLLAKQVRYQLRHGPQQGLSPGSAAGDQAWVGGTAVCAGAGAGRTGVLGETSSVAWAQRSCSACC